MRFHRFDTVFEELGALSETTNDTNTTYRGAVSQSVLVDVSRRATVRDLPALVTAAASFGPAATFILQQPHVNVHFNLTDKDGRNCRVQHDDRRAPDTQRLVDGLEQTYPASITGCWILNSFVSGVSKT